MKMVMSCRSREGVEGRAGAGAGADADVGAGVGADVDWDKEGFQRVPKKC